MHIEHHSQGIKESLKQHKETYFQYESGKFLFWLIVNQTQYSNQHSKYLLIPSAIESRYN